MTHHNTVYTLDLQYSTALTLLIHKPAGNKGYHPGKNKPNTPCCQDRPVDRCVYHCNTPCCQDRPVDRPDHHCNTPCCQDRPVDRPDHHCNTPCCQDRPVDRPDHHCYRRQSSLPVSKHIAAGYTNTVTQYALNVSSPLQPVHHTLTH